MHDFRFPGESDEYRRARDELLKAELELRRQIESVAAGRRELPLGGLVPTDYEFDEWDAAADGPKRVRLSELFGDKDTLFLYSFMVVPAEQALPFVGPCPSCTSIIDGVDGSVPAHHAADRVRGGGRAAHPGIPKAWRKPRVAQCAAAVSRSEHLQPRLRRRGQERLPVADRERVRPARGRDPSLLGQ